MTYLVYKNLAALNDLSPEEAKATFLHCCGSTRWSEIMTDERPFVTLENLFTAAEENWFALSAADQLEAFAAHPKIGDTPQTSESTSRSADWSTGEQSGVSDADDAVRAELAEVNRLYHEKFGFIFIVCATGKSAREMLAIAKARIRNSVQTELALAAEEQNKITRLRLDKFLEQ